MTRPENDPLDHETDSDSSQQLGPGTAASTADEQGLSEIADADALSVEELAESGQGYEAAVLAGVEDAADHPEKPVPSHEGQR